MRSVVVGATGAIGHAIVERLLDEGHAVLAVARQPEPLERLAGLSKRISTCAADVSSDDAISCIRDAAGTERVGLAVQCAAAPLGGGILSVEPEAITAAVEVKVNGLLRLVRALEAVLRPGSRVVAIGGSLGYDPLPDGSTAGIANAGLASAVRQLNRALAPRGITCNAIAPGPVATKRFARLAEEEARRRGVDVEEVIDEAAAAVPLGRLTTPDEVAWAVSRLAEPEAAAAAGSTIFLDGGRRTALP